LAPIGADFRWVRDKVVFDSDRWFDVDPSGLSLAAE
jgi:hypothetical protein